MSQQVNNQALRMNEGILKLPMSQLLRMSEGGKSRKENMGLGDKT